MLTKNNILQTMMSSNNEDIVNYEQKHNKSLHKHMNDIASHIPDNHQIAKTLLRTKPFK